MAQSVEAAVDGVARQDRHAERAIEDEDQRQYQGNDHEQARTRRLQVLELAAEFNVVAGWQRHVS